MFLVGTFRKHPYLEKYLGKACKLEGENKELLHFVSDKHKIKQIFLLTSQISAS